MSQEVTGARILDEIEDRFEIELGRAKDKFNQVVKDAAGEELRALGLKSNHSMIRYIVRKVKGGILDEQVVNEIRGLIPILRNAPSEAIVRVADKLYRSEAGQTEKDMHAKRSNAALINTIIRPLLLEPFWLKRMQMYEPDFNLEQFMLEANELRDEKITGASSLMVWATHVEDFFRKYVVDNDDTREVQTGRTAGRVRRGSERIYISAWNRYIRENADALFLLSIKPTTRSARVIANRSESRIDGFNQAKRILDDTNFSFDSPSYSDRLNGAMNASFDEARSFLQPSIGVSVSFDGSKATANWRSFDEALLEYSSWLRKVNAVYGEDNERADMSVAFDLGTKHNEYQFEDLDFEQTATKLKKLLEITRMEYQN